MALTTSRVADTVSGYVKSQSGASAPEVVAVDSLDLDAPAGSDAGFEDGPGIAYLQYTSGSTRTPAGVMMSHGNVLANFAQVTSDYFADFGNVAPPDTTVVSWLPFYHDMGLYLGVCAPILTGLHAVLTSPVAFLTAAGSVDAVDGQQQQGILGSAQLRVRTGGRKTSDEDMAGLDLVGRPCHCHR